MRKYVLKGQKKKKKQIPVTKRTSVTYKVCSPEKSIVNDSVPP
jgi:hypothetical protein